MGIKPAPKPAPILPRFPARPSMIAIESVRNGDADLGMIAVENSTYGRVADVHSLLPESGLHIVDESFVRVHVNLLGKTDAPLDGIKHAYGHPVILPQCGKFLREHKITPMPCPTMPVPPAKLPKVMI